MGFNEGDLKKLDIRGKRYAILVVFVIENSIKLRKMVLKGKISLVTSSQWQRLH
jgi:hypothetical protein